jgi:hypothetical protein
VDRKQRDQERGLLQSVGGVVGGGDDLGVGTSAAGAAVDQRAHRDDQRIGMRLVSLRAPCHPLGDGGVGGRAERFDEPGGEVEDRRRVLPAQRQQALLGGLEVADELGLDLVAQQPHRTTGAEPLRGRAQHESKVLADLLARQQVAERLAVAQRRPRRVLDGLVDELLAANLEERTVAVIVHHRPAQQLDGLALAENAAQALARLVPIDEEDQSRPEELQEL